MATTVKELREQLSRFPDDAPVVIDYGTSRYDPLSISQIEDGNSRYPYSKGAVALNISRATRWDS